MCVGDYPKHGMNRAAVTLKLIIIFTENPNIYQDVNTNFVLIAVIIGMDTSITVLRYFT
jgi:predicted small integral membrane protein